MVKYGDVIEVTCVLCNETLEVAGDTDVMELNKTASLKEEGCKHIYGTRIEEGDVLRSVGSGRQEDI